MKNIVLIGFMGTGKTSTGKVLAQRLGKAFIDMDSRIEEEQGQTIPQMFETKGEAYFRQCEKEMVKKVAARANAVIFTRWRLEGPLDKIPMRTPCFCPQRMISRNPGCKMMERMLAEYCA